MPVKRRISKGRKHLNDTDLEDLFYGPGTCQFNGEGYLGQHGDGFFADKSAEVQAQVLVAMREDWQRHRATILAAWKARTLHDRRIAKRYHGDPAIPWAQSHLEGEE